MKNILAAIDGSDSASRALDIAVTLAKANDATLTLLNVQSDKTPSAMEREIVEIEFADALRERLRWTQPPDTTAAEFAKVVMTQQVDTTFVIQSIISEQLMAKAVQFVRQSGIKNVGVLTKTGDVDDEIIDAVETNGFDIIVMGTRGRSDLKGLVLGSVSHKVAHDASCGVVLVK